MDVISIAATDPDLVAREFIERTGWKLRFAAHQTFDSAMRVSIGPRLLGIQGRHTDGTAVHAGAPPDNLSILLARTGDMEIRSSTFRRRLQAGEVCVYEKEEADSLQFFGNGGHIHFSVPRQSLREILRLYSGNDASLQASILDIRRENGLSASLFRVLSTFGGLRQTVPEGMSPQAAVKAAEDAALAILSSYLTESGYVGSIHSGWADYGVYNKAMAVIDAMTAPLSVVELAEAIGTSVRTLQLSFRRCADTTPYAVLKRARLQRLKTDLHDKRGSLAHLSGHWGFSNVTRLRADFVAEFGDLEWTAMLRRARGG